MLRRRAGALVHVRPLRLGARFSSVVAQPKRSRALLGVQLRLHVSYTYERAFLRVFSLPANMQLSLFFFV